MPKTLEQTQREGGPHHFLTQLAGDWEGMARTWFEPDKLADESPVRGSFRPALDGRFVIHEYEGRLKGERMVGLAVHGFDLHEDSFVMAWVDSAHNGTAIMFSEGVRGCWPVTTAVQGSYPDGQMGPRWGWRTEVVQPEPDRLIIRHYNIPPLGQAESLAVEFDYHRVASEPPPA